jgi:hypothetical protein
VVTMSDLLSRAIDHCDLLQLILEFYPEAFGHRDCFQRANLARVLAVWRSEKSPSVDLKQKGARWLYVDRATGLGGNAHDFLTKIVGMAGAQAAKWLIAFAGLSDNPRPPRKTLEERERAEFERRFREHCSGADISFLSEFAERVLCGLEPPLDEDGLAFHAIQTVGGFGSAVVSQIAGLLCDPVFVAHAGEEAVGQLRRFLLEVFADWFAEAFAPHLEHPQVGDSP